MKTPTVSPARASESVRVLIKGSFNTRAINQTRDHSYSHPADHGSDVVFIQLLARRLGQRPLLPSWLSNGGAHRKRQRAGNSIHALLHWQLNLSPSHMFKKLKLQKPCRNLVSVPDVQNKQYVDNHCRQGKKTYS